ncbi:MAG: hypothetical protein HZB38_06300 [Planctomycetes bacterium]|nr:hypothetical protein [Planctomycetota bacterium]
MLAIQQDAGSRFRGAIGVRLLLCLSLAAVLSPCAAAQGVPPGWSPELAEPFGLYTHGRYSDAINLCRSIADSNRGRVRQEAEALAAMAVMRSPSRTDRSEGRTRLAQIIRQQPDLRERPDVRLALGAARLGLNERAAALEELLAARDGFVRANRPDAALDVYSLLAEAWSSFGEWGTPILRKRQSCRTRRTCCGESTCSWRGSGSRTPMRGRRASTRCAC